MTGSGRPIWGYRMKDNITIPTDTLVAARDLLVRFQTVGPFRQYLEERLKLILPALVVFLVFIVASTAATVVFLSGLAAGMVLIAFLLAPFLLVGSLAVAAYLFLSWLEIRSLRHTLHHEAKGSPLPRIPWAWDGGFLIAPALLLLVVWWKLALVLLLLVAPTPVVYLRFDR